MGVRPVRVLVVDDDAFSRNVCRRVLSSILPGELHVEEADSGDAALAMHRREAFDIILADEFMPGMSGVELLELTLRETPDTWRVLVTGRASIDLVSHALDRARIRGIVPKGDVGRLRDELARVFGAYAYA